MKMADGQKSVLKKRKIGLLTCLRCSTLGEKSKEQVRYNIDELNKLVPIDQATDEKILDGYTFHNPMNLDLWIKRSLPKSDVLCCEERCTGLIFLPSCGHLQSHVYLPNPAHKLCEYCFQFKVDSKSLDFCGVHGDLHEEGKILEELLTLTSRNEPELQEQQRQYDVLPKLVNRENTKEEKLINLDDLHCSICDYHWLQYFGSSKLFVQPLSKTGQICVRCQMLKINQHPIVDKKPYLLEDKNLWHKYARWYTSTFCILEPCQRKLQGPDDGEFGRIWSYEFTPCKKYKLCDLCFSTKFEHFISTFKTNVKK